MFNIKTSISKISMVLNAPTKGMGFNSACRVDDIYAQILRTV